MFSGGGLRIRQHNMVHIFAHQLPYPHAPLLPQLQLQLVVTLWRAGVLCTVNLPEPAGAAKQAKHAKKAGRGAKGGEEEERRNEAGKHGRGRAGGEEKGLAAKKFKK